MVGDLTLSGEGATAPELTVEAHVDFQSSSAISVPNLHANPVQKQLLTLVSHLCCNKSNACWLGIDPIIVRSYGSHDLASEALCNT